MEGKGLVQRRVFQLDLLLTVDQQELLDLRSKKVPAIDYKKNKKALEALR